ncbi:hypothetical protein ABFS82_05G141600 [Erythranthe guttata]|uniref:Auxin-responsive protein n=1 Tax=Erythranthe guttata TaxID=4155 RepID=A0A022R0M3_ERYGU|nr:PREDICTED: auxin-responsive protein IAA28-like [Erythranthe guttata]EYU32350.1 hypothetical protein MIMGU_mgv1a019829mg [Erythranthe guttata]|eukprot:XP_012843471.1 PREDICTED: auxin-responsive protein IAA28-like [Erythranthe guttata]
MELELGLGLPNQSSSSSGHVMVKGLQLDLNSSSSTTYQNNLPRFLYRDVCSDHDHQEEVESKDLSLLLWSGQPNQEDDDPPPHKWTNLLHLNDDVQMNDDEEDTEIVGWPPINSVRKELLHRNQQQRRQRVINIIPGARNNINKSMYVKVKMEGVPIGRKIDLSLYHSYLSLTHAFIHMFSKYTAYKEENRDGGEYRILYQDKDGDWMLAGDVPWERFVESVRRVEIILRKDN